MKLCVGASQSSWADDDPTGFVSPAILEEFDGSGAGARPRLDARYPVADILALPNGGSIDPANSQNRFLAALTNCEQPAISPTSSSETSTEQDSISEPGSERPASIEPVIAEASSFPEISFHADFHSFLPRLGHDAVGVANNWNNALFLGLGLGGSLAIRSEFDGTVRDWVREHPDRWGRGSTILSDFGEPQYQIPVILGAYAFTVWRQDANDHAMMSSLISAYAISGLGTLAVKGIANTTRPNGNRFGFPSYHTSSTFAIAAVLDEYEGLWVGMPAYILAGAVGFARIDLQDHDLSDVVFGAVMGYVIGKSVSGKALCGDSRVHILPYRHPLDGSPGIALESSF